MAARQIRRAGEKPDGGREERVPRGLRKAKASPLRWRVGAHQRPTIAPHHDAKSPLSDHVQCRIRPSPRSFGLFAAEGLDQDRQAWRTGEGRPPAGAGADRYRQHVRGAGILRQDGGLRHPADRRLRTRHRFRRSGPERAQRAGRDAVANRAAGGARARLSQPDAAELAGVPGNADPPIAAYQVRLAERRCRRSDRADRRS